jgi:tetratricopeptide (TPR) repeat protein
LSPISTKRKYVQQSLRVCREIGDREGEAKALNVLSMLVSDQKAENYLRKALDICKDVGDRRGEGWTLHNLGRIYSNLGRKQEAEGYYARALHLRREVGDRRGQAWTLHNMGLLYLEQHNYRVALACLLLARRIFEKVQSPDMKVAQQNIERLHEEVGEEQFSTLIVDVEAEADSIVDQSLHTTLYIGENV